MTTAATKNPFKHLRFSDLRGVAQLATQGTSEVALIAEGVHQSVLSTLGFPAGSEPGRARGITGQVYRNVHWVTQGVGKCLDIVCDKVLPSGGSKEENQASTAEREAVLAAFNGVMGDRLAASNNPLAMQMTMRYQGEALSWPARSTVARPMMVRPGVALPPMPDATGKVLLMIHGLCMNDLQWHTQHDGKVVDHGETLAEKLGYTPVYLRYNSGLHISQNGRLLSAQLEQLVSHWPRPIEELTVVAHSMGGLLIRSAFHCAEETFLQWPEHLRNIVFLGTPHHGSPVERAGNWVDVILGGTPYSAPFAKIGQLRSAGITDLRYGYVLDEDWQGHDRFRPQPDPRRGLPLPEAVSCYTAAATTTAKRGVLANRLIGDGLVPLHSALGRHEDSQRNLEFPEGSQWIGFNLNHIELLSSPEVGRQIVQWLI